MAEVNRLRKRKSLEAKVILLGTCKAAQLVMLMHLSLPLVGYDRLSAPDSVTLVENKKNHD